MDEYIIVLCVIAPNTSRTFKVFEGYLPFVDIVTAKSDVMNLAKITAADPEHLKKWMKPEHFMLSEDSIVMLISSMLIMHETINIHGNQASVPMPPRLCCFIEKLKMIVANYAEVIDLSNLTFCENGEFYSIALYMEDIFEVNHYKKYACRTENVERIVAELHPINVRIRNIGAILIEIMKNRNIYVDFSDDEDLSNLDEMSDS